MRISDSIRTLLIVWIFLTGNNTNGQITKTVGSGGDYTTLKAAFDAINAGSITGAVTLKITGSTTETASAVLNASGSGSADYTSVNIYPASTGNSITGDLSLPLIDLNGADNVTIDGRVNATGSSNDLIITNTNTGTASTFRFINSAENNTIKYCIIKGSETSDTMGVIFFSTAVSGNGNDGNTIDNNNITSGPAGRPLNAMRLALSIKQTTGLAVGVVLTDGFYKVQVECVATKLNGKEIESKLTKSVSDDMLIGVRK